MGRKHLDQTLDFINTIDKAKSATEIANALLNTVAPFGLTNVLAGLIPHPGMTAQQQINNVVLSDWPAQWGERYFAQGYLFQDPTIHQLTKSTDPFFWADLEPAYRDKPASARIMNEASDFGLSSGFTTSIVTLEGQVAGFSLAGADSEVPPELRGMIQLLSIYAFAQAISLGEKPKQPHLTPRETEILRWAAEGKNEWEIGVILGVSEHTVDKMFRLARAKLGAVNRTQAVAYAIRHRVIS